MTLEEAIRHTLQGNQLEAPSPALHAIEDAAVEAPEALAPYLCDLFRVPAARSYILEAWRAADGAALSFLFAVVNGNADAAARDAMRALVHTRRRDTLERVPGAVAFAEEIGYEDGADGLRALHSETTLHVAFPPGIVHALHARWSPETWGGFAPDQPGHRFGGRCAAPCGRCLAPIDHLITLDPLPLALGLAAARITVGVCLSCIFEQNGELGVVTKQPGAFFRHDDLGHPVAVDVAPGPPARPELPSAPLVETTVQLVDLGPRFRIQPWGRRGRDNLCRVGGAPSWVQDAAYQKCPSCARTMTFLLQLDSGLPTTDGTHHFWANGGMAYVSWCDTCSMSHVQLQYT